MGAFLQQCFGTNWQADLMIVALLVTVPGFIVVMWRIQHAVNDLDFADWFRGANGKASWKEAQGIGGFMVGTWCVIYITLVGKVPEGYALVFLIYLAVCIGSPTAIQIINRLFPGNGPAIQPPNQQIKIDAPAGADVKVQTGSPPSPLDGA
jgi:hypothetical protein